MYRREEGLWARVPAAIVGGVITVYVTRAVSGTGDNIAGLIAAGIVFAIGAAATLFLCFFHAKTGEVLIDTETEMRKVVWPTREEVAGSTTVVIATTFILGLAIFVMDLALTSGLRIIRLY